MSITSDELNFLVYRYLQESGFVHSAFVFAYESLVGRANLATADIPPGALINFLQKGLQYVEIEKELEQRGDSEIANGLSLLSGARDTSKGDDPMEISESGAKRGKGPAASASPSGEDGGRTTMDLEGRAKPRARENGWVSEADVTQLSGHKNEVLACQWNPVCDVLASGSSDTTARIWTIPRGASGLPAGASASLDCKVLSVADKGTDEISGNRDVTSLDWRADGQQLVTGGYDGMARIWSLKGELKCTLECHKGPVFAVKWNRSGNYLLSGSVDKTAVVWDADTGTVLQQYDHAAPILDVAWRDDDVFASCSSEKFVYICKVGNEDPLKVFSGHTDEVNTVKWSPDGSLLASCSDDCTAKIWRLDQAVFQVDLKEHTKGIYQLQWGPRGTASESLLATASADNTVKVWDIEHAKSLHTLALHTQAVHTLAFSPDGNFVASGSSDATLRIWNVKDGKCVRKYKGNGPIYEVCWNKDGDKVAACHGMPSKSVCVIDFRK